MKRMLAPAVAICILVALGPAISIAAVKPATDEKPNIIYILLDDAGYGDFSCYGQTKFQTPNIDRIAREGIRFTDHYSGSTVCAPSRSALMTGLHTGHTHVRGNREVNPEGQAPLPADTVTMPRLLHKAGYTTGMFGKWGLGAPGSVSDPANHFDEFFGYNCQRQAHTYYPAHLWHNRKKVELDGKTYSQDLIAERALKFIRQHKDGPFFCYMPVTIPHAAMHVPEESAAPFRKKFSQFEDKIGNYRGPPVKNPVAAFAGMMTRLDGQIGQILDLLNELGIEDRTLVLLTSDNGPHQEGGHMPKFFNSSGGLRGVKRDLYEGGIRVPLLARWPGKTPAGTVSDHVSAHWDMLPTFCELAGIQIPKTTDGISIAPTLRGRSEQQKQHDYLYWEFYERGGARALRMNNYKAVRPKWNAPLELYDLEKDLAEKNDLASTMPDVVRKVEHIMQQAHTASELWKLPQSQPKQPRAKKKSA